MKTRASRAIGKESVVNNPPIYPATQTTMTVPPAVGRRRWRGGWQAPALRELHGSAAVHAHRRRVRGWRVAALRMRRGCRSPLLVRALVAVLAGLSLGLAVDATHQSAVSAHGAALAPRLPAHFFAPYVDTTLYPSFSITKTNARTGSRYDTLAFIVNTSRGGAGTCQATWGGYPSIGLNSQRAEVNALRAAGGNVIVSFGGVGGDELAVACSSAAALQAQYQRVIDAYNLTAIDLDIEGAAIANTAANERRARAIAGLQATAQAAGRRLDVSFTLPAELTGLDANGLALLRSAVWHGVRLTRLNLMTMDYYGVGDDPPYNTVSMGQKAIVTIRRTVKQLTRQIYPGLSSRAAYHLIGATPMIGVNDDQAEVFTPRDARQLLAFARQHGLADLAMWDANRDTPCPTAPTTQQLTCVSNAVEQTPFQFTRIFAAFDTPSGGPATGRHTVAGGLSQSDEAAVDVNGNVSIADYGHNRALETSGRVLRRTPSLTRRRSWAMV